MRYVLIGFKIDDETNQVYEMDILACEETKIFITNEDKEIYHQYDILKVYEDKTDEFSTSNTDKKVCEKWCNND